MSKLTKRIVTVAIMLMLALPAIALAAIPDANADSNAGTREGPPATTKVDPDTRDRWRHWAAGGGNETNVSTQNVGRIWTDKTVRAADNGKSDFLTTLSVMSSTSDTTITETKPLDIVLVLDASGSMDDPMGNEDRTRAIVALKSAANAFIDKIAANNEGVAADKQHQVAVIKFAGNKSTGVGNDTYRSGRYTYNYSQVMKNLTRCDATGATSLKNTVNAISPSGATRADYGMQLAQGISSSRNDAKKIVVFFTDGSPTSSSGFEGNVATNAVTSAKAIKDADATIYTIGIFSGANPNADPKGAGTSNENRFMHAVSSNFPSATSYTSRTLGSRADGSDYYKSAKTATELEKVFDGISQSITTGAGYPTHIEDGFSTNKTGYITFTDALGDFMQVDGFPSAEINGKKFDAASKSTSGNTDTYEFDGKAGNLVITVERADNETNPRQGDKITVKVPASLIPLRQYKIDKAKGTFEVADIDAVKPLRVTYASSVKDVARDNLFTPDKVTGLADYIYANWDRDANTVSFLANKWSGGNLGDTQANFRPSNTNNYYYLQKTTPLYTDEACTQRATRRPTGGATYYYKNEYVMRDSNGRPKDAHEVIAIDGSIIASFEGTLTTDDEGYALAKGTARLVFIDQLHTEKNAVGGNITNTARDVLNPEWNDSSSVAAATQVHSHLGNNGRITFGLSTTPAELDTKASFGLTKVLEGRKWNDSDKFTFEASLKSGDPNGQAMSKTSITVTKADADKQDPAAIDFGTITYTKAGTYVYDVSEKAGDASGIAYSTNHATITVTVTTDKSGALSAAVTKVENPTFTNTYTSELSYSAAGGLVITKTLNGHNMTAGQFTFTVTPKDADSAKALGLKEGTDTFTSPAAADGATVSIDVLGGRDVTFTQEDAGKTYSYSVAEKNDGAPGYTYDSPVRTVTIAVSDDGTGKLTATTTVTGGTVGNKAYTYVTGKTSEAAKVPFVNSYFASTDEQGGSAATVIATKEMTGRPLGNGEFTFHLAYAGTATPLKTVHNMGSTVDFGKLSYDIAMLDDLVKGGRATKSTADDGNFMWTIEYIAYEDTTNLPSGVSAAKQSFAVTVRVTDNGNGSLKAVATPADGGVFRNVYSTGDPILMQLNGVKNLTSADGLTPTSIAGKFTFTVTGEDGAPMPERTTATNDENGDIDFGGITFTLEDLNRALGTDSTTDTDSTDETETQSADAEQPAEADAASDTTNTPTAAADSPAPETNGPAPAENPTVAANNGDGAANDAGAEQQIDMIMDAPVAETVAFTPAKATTEEPTDAVDTLDENESAAQAVNDEQTPAGPRSHTFTYTITESGSAAGVTNDPASTRTVSFTLTDDGAGHLTVTRDPADGPAFTFTNSYSVTPVNSSVTDQLAVTKKLEGRDLAAGAFTFELLEGNDVVATGTNAADGNVTLSSITYDKPGTHTYTLREKGAGTVDRGVTYSGAVYTVITTVADNGDGTLSVTHAFEGADVATFTNVYEAAPASVKITATKTLDGRSLKDGEFSFTLKGEGDANGINQTVKNDENGNIAFDELTFDKPGTYTFAITEVKGDEKGMTYDDAAYTATVTVTDNGEGQLEASIAYTKGEKSADAIAFHNTFETPETPDGPKTPDTPKTPNTPGTPKTPGRPSSSGPTHTISKMLSRVLPATGDESTTAIIVATALAIAGAGFIVYARRRS